MQWKNLFSPVENLDAGQARIYMDEHGAGAYQLLDVRQPKEYEAGHLPGARFIPLGELATRMDELDPDKPVIAYCAVGGRSRAAAQLLSGKGFRQVYNLSGGIKAWHHRTAVGPFTDGLDLFAGDEEYGDAVQLAYGMEDALQGFYLTLARELEGEESRALFSRLAGFEDKHKARLAAEHQAKTGNPLLAVAADTDRMEGGSRTGDLLSAVKASMPAPRDIIGLAMELETQALDLYSRMAQKSIIDSTRDLFLGLVDEEQTHLRYLARELDNVL